MGYGETPKMLYLSLKMIHILSATLLFGTGLGSAYYMFRSYLHGDAKSFAMTCRHVVMADWLFTSTTVIIQPATGIWMVYLAGFSLSSLWISLTLALYVVAGLCWLPVVWLQIKIQKLAEQSALNNTPLPAQVHRYMKIWFLLGWPAFISIMIIFYLMVFKPMVWG